MDMCRGAEVQMVTDGGHIVALARGVLEAKDSGTRDQTRPTRIINKNRFSTARVLPALCPITPSHCHMLMATAANPGAAPKRRREINLEDDDHGSASQELSIPRNKGLTSVGSNIVKSECVLRKLMSASN